MSDVRRFADLVRRYDVETRETYGVITEDEKQEVRKRIDERLSSLSAWSPLSERRKLEEFKQALEASGDLDIRGNLKHLPENLRKLAQSFDGNHDFELSMEELQEHVDWAKSELAAREARVTQLSDKVAILRSGAATRPEVALAPPGRVADDLALRAARSELTDAEWLRDFAAERLERYESLAESIQSQRTEE
ncbi:MAG: hypothetical protein AAF654_08035 [Myxococcota bacterium]